MSQTDLFGFGPAQASLFGDSEDRLPTPRQNTEPDQDDIRGRLTALLDKARSADRMPWSDRDARMWQIVFPNMAKWLPEAEANQLSFEFEQEMERLRQAA